MRQYGLPAAIGLLLVLAQVVPLPLPHVMVVAALTPGATAQLQLASGPSIYLLGEAWDHVSLSVLIVKPSWLGEQYVDAVKEAFAVWDKALESFGNSYGYPYLSQFSFSVTVSATAVSGYDITVEFTSTTATAGGEIGVTRITYVGNKIVSALITLYVYTSSGQLTPTDVMNVALHEIGHALGLGHATSSTTDNGPEVMYPVYSFPGIALRPSTLDAYAVAKVYAWLPSGVFAPPPSGSISLPTSIPYRMLLYYKVTVYSEYGVVTGAGWYAEGATAKVSVEKTVVELGPGTRAVFTGWTGYVKSSSPTVVFRVYEDVTLRANWKIQHYVNVSTPYASASPKPGWYDEGSRIRVSVSETVVYTAPGVRHVFTGWTGTVEAQSPSLEVVVDKPITLVARWKTQYYVNISTRYSSPLAQPGWYDRGTRLKVGVEQPVIRVSPGVRLVLEGWRGTVSVQNASFTLTVDRPLTLWAVWAREFYVRVETPYSKAAPESGWYREGTVVAVSLEKRLVYQGNETRRVFLYWVVDGHVVRSYPLRLRIDKPHVVKAVWRTEYLVRVCALSGDGRGIAARLRLEGPRPVVLTTRSGCAEAWLASGEWRVVGAEWVRLDEPGYPGSFALGRKTRVVGWAACPVLVATFNVTGPGRVDVLLGVWNVTVRVVDALGVPAPFYRVELAGLAYQSDLDGFAAETQLASGTYGLSYSLWGVFTGSLNARVDSSGTLVVRVPVSLYTLAVLFVLAVAASVVAARVALRRRGYSAPS